MELHNKPQTHSTPYQVFLHLMMVAMYYVASISLVTLLVQYIDLIFPDQLIGYSGSYDVIRSTSSALLVTFPFFLLTTWFIRRAFKIEPVERKIGIRRWLIYLTLFIAAVTMVIDLVQFVNGFYSGELTLPFFLKLLAVLIISLLTFTYFIYDLKDDGISSQNAKILSIISSIILLIILGAGFFLAGSPSHQRAVRFDEQRINDLQNIEYEIGNYWRDKKSLPPDLTALNRDLYYFQLPVDPETKENYGYETVDALSFKICANFSAEYQSIPNTSLPSEQWSHFVGKTCFKRKIDPDFFKSNVIK